MKTINPNSVGHGWSRAVRIGTVIQIIALWQNPKYEPLATIAYSILCGVTLSHDELYLILITLVLPLVTLLPFALAASVIAPYFAGVVALAFSVGSILWVAFNGLLYRFFADCGELYGACLMSVILVYLLAAGLCAAQCRHVPRESRPFWLFLPPIALTPLAWLNFAVAIPFMRSADPWLPIALAGTVASLVILIGWLGWWRAYAKAQKAAP
jgi:hypothetical protein